MRTTPGLCCVGMVTLRRLLVTLASLTLAMGPVTPATGATAASVTITSLSFDRSSVAPSGLNHEKVKISVGLSSSSDIDIWCAMSLVPPQGPTVTIQRITPVDPRTKGDLVPSSFTGVLDLAAGTLSSGVWATSVTVPSTWTGTWQVSRISACTGGTIEPVEIDPRSVGRTVSLAVAGSHVPRLSAGATPSPLALNAKSFTAKGRLYDTDTGAGLPGVRLLWCGNILSKDGMEPPKDTCTGTAYAGDFWADYIGHPISTDAAGYWSVSWPNDGYFREIDVWTQESVGSGGPPGYLPPKVLTRAPEPVISPAVTATPASTSIRAGRALTVNGAWYGKYGCSTAVRNEIRIQYLYGSTAWRLITTTSSRPSGRWTAVYPARAGRAIYRAYYPGVPGKCVSAASGSFVVTGS
jgi:hypothetical protein